MTQTMPTWLRAPIRLAPMARTCVLGLALSSALLAMEGCSTTPTNVSDMQPYATLIGAEYYVAAEGLQAYGMYDGYQNKLGWITLIPGDGIAGPQVAFKRPVAKESGSAFLQHGASELCYKRSLFMRFLWRSRISQRFLCGWNSFVDTREKESSQTLTYTGSSVRHKRDLALSIWRIWAGQTPTIPPT